jgi:protein SCO1
MRRRGLVLIGVVLLLAAGVGSAIALLGHTGYQPSANGNASGGLGTPVEIAVPPALRHIPLASARGKTLDLASWSGKTVLLVPFLTLCQDVCPMITGNLLQIQQSLRADRAAREVEIVELSVDPTRDTPARLAAYAKLTGASWQLVTERPSDLRALAKFFGFYYQKVPEYDRAARDWWTGKPLTYDVDHTDNYFVIDPKGVERVENNAAPAFRGKLNPTLYRFLNALGRAHLKRAPQPDWTPANALQALGLSMHRSLTVAPLS